MEESRLETAVSLLKQCKAEGKTYYEATQVLARQRFSELEIEQASYQFPYTTFEPQVNKPPQAPLQSQSIDSKENTDEAQLQEAKARLNKDFWYSFIPIAGGFYKAKRVSDYAKYESLKTGYSQSTMITSWMVVMVASAIVSLIAAPKLVGIFSKNSEALYLSHYIGPAVAILLLWFIFRTRKKG